jgi:hypothetical protein
MARSCNRKRLLFGIALSSAIATSASAGPFTNAGIAASDPAIVGWADGIAAFAPTPSGAGVATSALGPANGTVVSLGDLNASQIANGDAPGSITLTFSTPIRNGPGADLAVFENAGLFFALPVVFAELAFVEVSSNGFDFARFPSVSLNTEGTGNPATDIVTTFGRSFAGIDRTNTYNLAGIHESNVGTLFDLADLLPDPLVGLGLLNLNAVSHVRLVDVPGDGSFLDSLGNPILDAWVTTGTGGFDLDAVAALHIVPEPGAALLLALGLAGLTVSGRRR